MNATAFHARFWNVARLGALAAYLLFGGVLGLRNPGLYYDEAIFLNGAVQVLHSGGEPSFAHDPWSWVTIFGRRWPIMVMPYAGALRDYLALLPFSIFGPNYYTARILTTLVGAFGILGLSVLVRDQFGVQAAAAASWILAIHPAYLALTIYGGGAEWMAPFGAFSIALARYLRTPVTSSAFWLGAAMGFGVWSRANFCWLLGSALLAGAIVAGGRMRIPLLQLAVLAGGGVIGGAPLLLYEIHSHGATFTFLWSSTVPEPFYVLAAHRLNLLSQTLISDGEMRKMWNGPPIPFWQLAVFCIIVAVALCYCLVKPGLARSRAAGRVTALTFLFLLSCMLCSRLNISEHHMVALIPIAAVLVSATAEDSCRRWRDARYLVCAAAVIYLGCVLYWNLTAARQIRSTGGVGLWSNAIDSVTAYVEQNYADRKVKVLDWGLNNSLFVLSGARIASTELFWGATAERTGMGTAWRDEISTGDVYVLHSPGLAVFPEAGRGFAVALAGSTLPFRKVQFTQNSGDGYAEVVEILDAGQ